MSLYSNLHNGQKEFVRRVLDSTTHTVVLNGGRWWGKDTALIAGAMGQLQMGKEILILGHVHSDNKKVFDRIRRIDVGGVFEYKLSPLTITSSTGGVIKFRSYKNADNIRGDNFNDVCFLNEAALLSDEDYMFVLKPMFRGFKKVVITSTPRNTEWYRNVVAQGLIDGNKVWTKTASTYENPFADRAEIDKDRLSMPDNIFRQEYLAEFVDNSGAVFGEPTAAFTLAGYGQPTSRNFAGVDFGARNDWTVLHILNAHGETIYKDRFKDDDLTRVSERVMPKIIEFNAATLAESNGLGVYAVAELHKRAPSLINDFHQTNKTKEDIIGLLRIEMSGTPQIAFRRDDANLLHELKKLEYKNISGSKNIRYEAAAGHHDDEVVAVAMANFIRRNYVPRR